MLTYVVNVICMIFSRYTHFIYMHIMLKKAGNNKWKTWTEVSKRMNMKTIDSLLTTTDNLWRKTNWTSNDKHFMTCLQEHISFVILLELQVQMVIKNKIFIYLINMLFIIHSHLHPCLIYQCSINNSILTKLTLTDQNFFLVIWEIFFFFFLNEELPNIGLKKFK